MKNALLVSLLSLSALTAHAQIRDFQTTRLNSTAGAGVASVLSTEAAILNPASGAFFSGETASYQGYTTALRNKNQLRDTIPDKFSKHNTSTGAFVGDNSGTVKGGVAYVQQNENDYRRERIIFHAAAPIDAKSAMGLTYGFLSDRKPPQTSNRYDYSHQMRIGTLHVLSENLSLGFVLIDPARAVPGEERFIGGFQYVLTDKLTLIADGGVQYTKAVKEENLWRAAVQVNVFKDFFVRGGRFYDNVTEFRGWAWGASWIGPRLGLEFAMKTSERFGKNTYIYDKETLVDTSLAAVIKF
jgi:hypothetical protein